MQKTIAFDLDDTLCKRTTPTGGKEKYESCFPVEEMISISNELYDRGHKIIIFTARGMSIFDGDVEKVYQELFDLTSSQLKEWGVKYHELVMGKIHYDLLVDDKVINESEINEIGDLEKWV